MTRRLSPVAHGLFLSQTPVNESFGNASGRHSRDQCDLSVLNLDVQGAASLGHRQPKPVGLDPLTRQPLGQAFARQTRRRQRDDNFGEGNATEDGRIAQTDEDFVPQM